jgi:hypothetical protein
VRKNTKSTVVANRLEEVGCLPLPQEVRQRIDQTFDLALRKAEIDLAAELLDKKSVARIFREVMCPSTRGDLPLHEAPPPLLNSGNDEAGGGAL